MIPEGEARGGCLRGGYRRIPYGEGGGRSRRVIPEGRIPEGATGGYWRGIPEQDTPAGVNQKGISGGDLEGHGGGRGGDVLKREPEFALRVPGRREYSEALLLGASVRCWGRVEVGAEEGEGVYRTGCGQGRACLL